MAIVNILAEKADFIGLQCWLKLCVNYQNAPWDFIGAAAYYFSLCLYHLFSQRCCPSTLVVLYLFMFLGVFCHFQFCAVIITHHYGSNQDMHEKHASVRKEEEEERGRGGGERGEKAQRKGKRNVTAEAQRVGGECRRGRTWSWLRRSLQLVSSH